MIFETYFKHVYLYVACLYATSGTGLYAQTLHQHAGTQRDTVPVTFPVQHLEEVVITAGRPGITAGAVSNRISSSEIHRAAGSSLATLLERIRFLSSGQYLKGIYLHIGIVHYRIKTDICRTNEKGKTYTEEPSFGSISVAADSHAILLDKNAPYT